MEHDNQFTIRLAEKVIAVHPLHGSLARFCRSYIVDAPADFEVSILGEDIDFEREKSALQDNAEANPVGGFSLEYLETLALHRKISEKMLDYDTFLFHGSAIAVDGECYLFTAKSGVGKSTHARLWREMLGSRAVMVNDDKPFIRVTDCGAFAYGAPWDGKHRLSSNIGVKLKGLALLSRSETNHIEPITGRDAFPMLYTQTYRPDNTAALAKTLALLGKLSQSVKLWSLGCNMEPEAAKVSYGAMSERKDIK